MVARLNHTAASLKHLHGLSDVAPLVRAPEDQTSSTLSPPFTVDYTEHSPFDLFSLLRGQLQLHHKQEKPDFSVQDLYLIGDQDAIPVINAFLSKDESVPLKDDWHAFVFLYTLRPASGSDTFISHQFITNRIEDWVFILQSCSFKEESYYLYSVFNEESTKKHSLKSALERCIPAHWPMNAEFQHFYRNLSSLKARDFLDKFLHQYDVDLQMTDIVQVYDCAFIIGSSMYCHTNQKKLSWLSGWASTEAASGLRASLLKQCRDGGSLETLCRSFQVLLGLHYSFDAPSLVDCYTMQLDTMAKSLLRHVQRVIQGKSSEAIPSCVKSFMHMMDLLFSAEGTERVKSQYQTVLTDIELEVYEASVPQRTIITPPNTPMMEAQGARNDDFGSRLSIKLEKLKVT